jgi:phosphate transport system substrate-binding protein
MMFSKKKMLRAITLCLIALLLMSAAPVSGLGESWSQMNQLLVKSDTWEQIVVSSRFSLGEAWPQATESGQTFTQVDFGAYPSIDGSTVAVPMAVEFARQHLGLSDADIHGFVAFSTTPAAYEHLIRRQPNGSAILVTQNAMMDDARPVDLFIGTEPSQEEQAMAEASGVQLTMKPVCFDAFVFIVHKDNPVNSLTVEQIQRIYTREFWYWTDVSEASEWAAAIAEWEDPYHNWEDWEESWLTIEPYQRNPGSGSQTVMENLVMKGKRLAGKGASGYFQNEMSALIEAIGGESSSTLAIGYTFKYYIDKLYQSEDIKVLAVNGVYPTAENVRSGAYPFSTSYYGVIRAGEEQETGGLFLDWMVSEEGQQCIRQAGYIPYLTLGDE